MGHEIVHLVGCTLQVSSQIFKNNPRPRIRLRVMASSAMGSNWGLQVFADQACKNKRKTNAPTIFGCRAAYYVCFIFTFRQQ